VITEGKQHEVGGNTGEHGGDYGIDPFLPKTNPTKVRWQR
jgi:hypothetical protein